MLCCPSPRQATSDGPRSRLIRPAVAALLLAITPGRSPSLPAAVHCAVGRRSGADGYYCGQVTDPDSLHASDMEREAAVERLRVASVEGRLTLGELTTRTEAAYTAQARGELARVMAGARSAGRRVRSAVNTPAGDPWLRTLMCDRLLRVTTGTGSLAGFNRRIAA
jgi:hypothetical protein